MTYSSILTLFFFVLLSYVNDLFASCISLIIIPYVSAQYSLTFLLYYYNSLVILISSLLPYPSLLFFRVFRFGPQRYNLFLFQPNFFKNIFIFFKIVPSAHFLSPFLLFQSFGSAKVIASTISYTTFLLLF